MLQDTTEVISARDAAEQRNVRIQIARDNIQWCIDNDALKINVQGGCSGSVVGMIPETYDTRHEITLGVML